MNRRQKIVQQQFLDNEEEVLKRLKAAYSQSLKDIEKKTAILQGQITDLQAAIDAAEDEDEKARLKSMHQSKVYQKQYQDALKKQVGSILDDLQVNEFTTIEEYLNKCYEDGFVGALYDMQGQGVPLAFPLDQEAMVRAVQIDSKISQGLYARLGEDVSELKKKITSEIARGISTGATFAQIAGQLKSKTNIGYNNAVRIARTEGHRIQCQGTMDACYKAKEKGADVVKQWDATLDARTRDSHVAVDGEVKEIGERFSNGLMFPGDPHGTAGEVVNCRCALLERARWAVGGGFTKMNNFTKELETFDSPEAYDEFKKAFYSKENRAYMNYVESMETKYGTRNFEKVLGKMTDREYKHYSALLERNPVFNKNADKVKPRHTFDSVKLTGIDADYLPDIESTLDGLMMDYPISGLRVSTSRSTREFGHFQGGVKGTKKGGEQYAVTENEVCISKSSYCDKATSTDEHKRVYEYRESALKDVERCDLATIPHEYGHAIDHAYVLAKEPDLRAVAEKYATPQKIASMSDVEAINDFNRAVAKSNSRLSKEIFDELQEEYGLDYMGTVMRIDQEYGSYASSSVSEFLAEAFANMRMLPDDQKTDFMRSFEKIFNRKFNEVLGE